MPIEITRLASEITPTRIVLFFGAGASVGSNAPSVAQLFDHFKVVFKEDPNGYSFREFTGINMADGPL